MDRQDFKKYIYQSCGKDIRGKTIKNVRIQYEDPEYTENDIDKTRQININFNKTNLRVFSCPKTVYKCQSQQNFNKFMTNAKGKLIIEQKTPEVIKNIDFQQVQKQQELPKQTPKQIQIQSVLNKTQNTVKSRKRSSSVTGCIYTNRKGKNQNYSQQKIQQHINELKLLIKPNISEKFTNSKLLKRQKRTLSNFTSTPSARNQTSYNSNIKMTKVIQTQTNNDIFECKSCQNRPKTQQRSIYQPENHQQSNILTKLSMCQENINDMSSKIMKLRESINSNLLSLSKVPETQSILFENKMYETPVKQRNSSFKGDLSQLTTFTNRYNSIYSESPVMRMTHISND